MEAVKKKSKKPLMEFIPVISVEYNIEGGKRKFEIGSLTRDLGFFEIDHIIDHLKELKTTIKKQTHLDDKQK
jgi:hypothetical protein